MAWVSKLLFENPPWLLAMLAAGGVVALVIWRARRTIAAARTAIVLVALAAAVLLLGGLVKTDREKIADAYAAMAADVSAGRTEQLAVYLDADARITLEPGDEFGADKRSAILLVGMNIKVMKLREVKLSRMTIDVSGDRAVSEVTTTIFNDWSETAGATIVLSWRVVWAKRADGWRIVEAQPTGQAGMLQAN